MFPVGHLTKQEVREIALRENLNVASKKDSTGICFIGERHYQEFIRNYLKPNPGDIVNVETKEVIGRHKGLMNYTIGQRKNVGLSGFLEKHYVCGKDVEKNILYVAFGEDSKYLNSDECTLESVNWISDKRPRHCTAKFRYRAQDYDVDITYLDDGNLKVSYPEEVKSVTPGQFCVFYDKEECLGSGVINKIYKDGEELWYL